MRVSARSTKTHHAILDAAIHCYALLGIEQTHMVDIADEAGIGRTTLYRHFKSQNDILVQAITRDAYAIFDELQIALQTSILIEDKIIDGFSCCLATFSKRPLMSLLLNTDTIRLVLDMGVNLEEIRITAIALAEPIYDAIRAQGRLRDHVSLGNFIEWLGRLLIALQTQPNLHHDPEHLRYILRNFVLPSLLRD